MERCAAMFHAMEIRPRFGFEGFEVVLNPEDPHAPEINEYAEAHIDSSIVNIDCVISFIAALSTHKLVMTVEANSPVTADNVRAQWLTQSGVRNKRPFFDHGLTGAGQIVSVSDTGLDIDNCYFRDEKGAGNVYNGVSFVIDETGINCYNVSSKKSS